MTVPQSYYFWSFSNLGCFLEMPILQKFLFLQLGVVAISHSIQGVVIVELILAEQIPKLPNPTLPIVCKISFPGVANVQAGA